MTEHQCELAEMLHFPFFTAPPVQGVALVQHSSGQADAGFASACLTSAVNCDLPDALRVDSDIPYRADADRPPHTTTCSPEY